MGVDLGMDSQVETLEGAADAGAWHDALLAVVNLGGRSDRNPFGAAAKQPSSVVEVPTGSIARWAGAAGSVPDGWLACDGAAVSRTTFADLFAVVGSTFGSTATTFNVPDYRRRVSVGAGGSRPTGSLGPGTSLGDTGGAETVSLTAGQLASHSHGLDLSLESSGAHTHQVYQGWRRDGNDSLNTLSYISVEGSGSAGTLDDAGEHAHGITGEVGAAGSETPTPVPLASKSVVLTYIIKT